MHGKIPSGLEYAEVLFRERVSIQRILWSVFRLLCHSSRGTVPGELCQRRITEAAIAGTVGAIRPISTVGAVLKHMGQVRV